VSSSLPPWVTIGNFQPWKEIRNQRIQERRTMLNGALNPRKSKKSLTKNWIGLASQSMVPCALSTMKLKLSGGLMLSILIPNAGNRHCKGILIVRLNRRIS